MRIYKLILCFITVVLFFSSCTVEIGVTETKEQTIVTDSITETVANITEEAPTETFETPEKAESSFVINKNTKKYHAEDCHYVGFMNEENKLFVISTPEKLQSKSYNPCYYCQK